MDFSITFSRLFSLIVLAICCFKETPASLVMVIKLMLFIIESEIIMVFIVSGVSPGKYIFTKRALLHRLFIIYGIISDTSVDLIFLTVSELMLLVMPIELIFVVSLSGCVSVAKKLVVISGTLSERE